MTFETKAEERYFEDYRLGAVHETGSITVSEADIIEFARQFDPQPFHVDPRAAKQSVFSGIIASGWHTASLAMRLLVDHYVSPVASLGSPGADELRWLEPVRPGDSLSLRVTILEVKTSHSKPDRGTVRTYVEVMNQHRQVVMTWKGIGMMKRRNKSGVVEDNSLPRL